MLGLLNHRRLKQTLAQTRTELLAAKNANELAQRTLAARTQTMDRLLDFSQTIQGAGQSDQIFSALAYFLRQELSLAGLAIVTHEPDAIPATAIKASWPPHLLRTPCAAGASSCSSMELDGSVCPCLRQNQPKDFNPGSSPVRCAIDQYLTLGEEYPAYCIPFTIGRKIQAVVHMHLPPHQAWADEQRQLAQTYVNTAQSTLVSLHMLAEAEKQSMTDGLTGLYNRRSMDQLLQREMALAERHTHPLSVVMIDMDHFKQINDAHGHAAGDHMLRSFADCVRITLRKTDLAFRYGGDEFAIALPQTPVSQAQQVVQKLRQAFASVDFADAIAHLDHQPTLSIGVAERSKQGNTLTLQALLAAADQALYEAKSTTRNCIKIYQAAA